MSTVLVIPVDSVIQLSHSARPGTDIQIDAHTLKRIVIAAGPRLGQDMQEAINLTHEADETDIDKEALAILEGAVVDFRLAYEASQLAERIHLWIDAHAHECIPQGRAVTTEQKDTQ